jgi:hypothetical protein
VSDEDLRWVCVGADKLAALLAKTYDAADDKRFGYLMGYPSCCIDFYCSHHDREGFRHDLIQQTERPANNRYIAAINNACMGFGHSLISHFPCCWDCEPSIQLAQKTIASVRRYDAQMIEESLYWLESDVLYSEKMILAIKNGRWDGHYLSLTPGSFQFAGGDLIVDAISLQNGGVMALHRGRVVAHLDPVVWLPFHTQRFPGDCFNEGFSLVESQ